MERPIGIGAKFYFWKLNFVLYVAGIATIITGVVATTALFIITNNVNGDISPAEYENIILNGEHFNGLIKSVEIKENITTNGAHPANISFVVFGGDTTTYNVFAFAPEMTDSLKTGDLVDLKILEDKFVVVVGLKPVKVPTQIAFFTIGLAGIGVLIFIILNKKCENLIYLSKTGLVAKATVTLKKDKTHKPSNVQYSYNSKIFLIEYFYIDSNGNQRFGKGLTPGSNRVKKLRKDDEVTILIDTKDQSNSTLFPFELSGRYNWNDNVE